MKPLFNFKKKEEKPKEQPKAKVKKPAVEKEPQYYRSKTNIQTLNYKVYYMTKKEMILYILLGFVVGGLAGYAFFGGQFKDEFGVATKLTLIVDILLFVVFGTLAARFYLPIRTKQLCENRKRQLTLQFRDMLEALTTSLNAGKNVTDAFKSSYEDLGNQYESGAMIMNELEVINTGLINGITLEELLKDFADRSGIDDIADFTNVFEICYRKGGNIKEVIRNTYDVISDKITVREDIITMYAGTKIELNMMLVLPLAMIIVMKLTSTDFANNYASVSGLVSEIVGITIVIVAYMMAKKIVDIKI